MNKLEALMYARSNPGVCLKLDWWDFFMYFYFSADLGFFVSGGGSPIDIEFLLPGNYITLDNPDRALGGLFLFDNFLSGGQGDKSPRH